jgi:hypothetical protein
VVHGARLLKTRFATATPTVRPSHFRVLGVHRDAIRPLDSASLLVSYVIFLSGTCKQAQKNI